MSRPATGGGAPRIPRRSDYGDGAFRRAIRLEARGEVLRGELADDFHHFGVRLAVRDGRVSEIEGEDVRVPWTTCPGALAPLLRMRGAPVTDDLSALRAHTDARVQCTHLHDLACLAVSHAARVAARGADRRRYDVTLPDRRDGAATAVLRIDDTATLEWALDGSTIRDSNVEAFVGAPLSGPVFKRAMAAVASVEVREAAWVLQRAIFIGTGRRHDFESMEVATEFASVVGGNCHSFAPERAPLARKIPGTVRTFSATDDVFRRD